MVKKTVLIKTFLLFLFVLLFTHTALAASSDEGQGERALSYTVNTVIFGNVQNPAHSTQNPDNAFLNLYRYSTELDVRPDFFLDRPDISAVFKPRFTTDYRWWEDGAPKGRTDSQSKAFVNEWRVQVKPFSTLFFSFGKEKLLWGPSFLAGPSNILFKDTEKVNPKSEVEGKYLAKVIYVPNNTVTINVIRETQHDTDYMREKIKPLNIVKADLLGSDYLVSAIGYYRQDDRFRFGSFGQWTVSDALVVYYDGIITKGTDVLYPAPDQINPMGGALVKEYDGSARLFSTVAGGGSYTFLSGSTLSMEFLYNGQGYNNAEAKEYYRLRQNAHNHFFDNSPLAGLSRMTLNETLNNGLPFLRRYYLMGQYHVREIRNVLDIAVRYIHGLEENAGQASTILEWQITKRINFFNINSVAVDHGKETEFNSLIRESCLVGIEIHF